MHRGRSLRDAVASFATLTALSLVLVGAPAVGAPAVSTAAAVECPPTASPTTGGIDMTATVLGPEGAPCGPATSGGGGSAPSGTGTGGGAVPSRGGSNAGTAPAASDVSPPVETPAPAADDVDLGGTLTVGGLETAYRPSWNPFGGDMQMWFTIRNVSDSTITGSADFWMENVLGLRVGEVSGIDVVDLRPGEMRTVGTEVPGAGQWTVLSSHVTFTPPEQVDGVELSPITRDATAFAVPWFVLLLIVVGAASWGAVLLIRRREPAGDAFAEATA
jgi:hypothetical protein